MLSDAPTTKAALSGLPRRKAGNPANQHVVALVVCIILVHTCTVSLRYSLLLRARSTILQRKQPLHRECGKSQLRSWEGLQSHSPASTFIFIMQIEAQIPATSMTVLLSVRVSSSWASKMVVYSENFFQRVSKSPILDLRPLVHDHFQVSAGRHLCRMLEMADESFKNGMEDVDSMLVWVCRRGDIVHRRWLRLIVAECRCSTMRLKGIKMFAATGRLAKVQVKYINVSTKICPWLSGGER